MGPRSRLPDRAAGFRHLMGFCPTTIALGMDLGDLESRHALATEIGFAMTVGFSPDGGLAFAVVRDHASVDHELRFWRVPSGECVGSLFVPGVDFKEVRIARGGRVVAAPGSDGTVRVVALPPK